MKLVLVFLMLAASAYSVPGPGTTGIGQGLQSLIEAFKLSYCGTHQCVTAIFSGVRCVEWRERCGCDGVGYPVYEQDSEWKCICDRSKLGGGFPSCPDSPPEIVAKRPTGPPLIG